MAKKQSEKMVKMDKGHHKDGTITVKEMYPLYDGKKEVITKKCKLDEYVRPMKITKKILA